MKRIGFLVILGVFLISTTLVMAGRGGSHCKGRGGGCGCGFRLSPFILSGLDLTSEQMDSVNTLRDTLRTDIKELHTSISEKRKEVGDLWKQTTLDIETIKAKCGEILVLKGQMMEKRMDFRVAVRGLLTPEQLAELIESIEKWEPMRLKGKKGRHL